MVRTPKQKIVVQIMAVTIFLIYLSLLCYQNVYGLYLNNTSDNFEIDKSVDSNDSSEVRIFLEFFFESLLFY